MRVGPVLFISICVSLAGTAFLTFGAGHGARGDPATTTTSQTVGETPSPELARARTYARKAERRAYRQASRAERNERRLAHARVVFRRSLGTSPLGNHWLENAFVCIHHHEGRWGDRGAPYYGGLQMDWSFMRSYGGEYLHAFGPASNWPRSVQVAVAIKAYLSRGFGPWPATRRMCGL